MKNTSKDKVSIYLFNAYSNLNPEVNFISGSDRVGINLIDFEKDKPVVIAPQNFQSLLHKGVFFYSSDNLKSKNLLVCYFKRLIKTIQLINVIKKDFKIEKIVSTSDFFPDVIPCFIFSFGLKWYAFTYHLYPLKLNFRDFFGRIIQIFSYLLFLNSHKVITSSKECQLFLRKYLFLSKIAKISLGIEISQYRTNVTKNLNLVYLGRIKNSKGVYDLPEIVSLVKINIPWVKLNIIGNGSKEDTKKLIDLIAKYQVTENIQIFQNLSDKEVIYYLNESSTLLQPSYEEGFGLSVLEGLASNMNIVLYNLPVYQEHFKDFNLTYIELGDRKGFAERIIEIISTRTQVSYPLEMFKRFSWSYIFSFIYKD
jgi:glycosyltransferase involved in cell wall biosynthesis